MSVLIDPENYDSSEEQFEASLNAAAPAGEEPAREEREDAVWNLVASAVPARREETNPVDETPYWREEVTSRIESYRARRKRPPRERSLSLDFERAVNRAVNSSQAPLASEPPVASRQSPVPGEEIADQNPGSNAEETAQAASDQLSIGNHIPPQDSPVTSGAAAGDCAGDSNVIEFPRPLVVMPPSAEELAEPIIDKPRILDAPEEVETAQAPLAGIRLAPEEEAPAVEFELPLVVANMSQRAFAGLLDALVVSLASGVFLMIVLRGGATLPPGKAGALLLVAAPILFWAVYEYLFLVHAGTTPGMQMARLHLVSFEAGPVRRRTRRGRALALVLSCLSLGLGLLWALLDEDTLCWHDRISRTYLVSSS